MPLMLLNPSGNNYITDPAEQPLDPGIASRPFEAPAPRSDWHNDVSILLQELKGEPLNANARAYVEAAPQAFREYGDEGLRVQLLYIISSLRATTPNLKRLKKEIQVLAKRAPNPKGDEARFFKLYKASQLYRGMGGWLIVDLRRGPSGRVVFHGDKTDAEREFLKLTGLRANPRLLHREGENRLKDKAWVRGQLAREMYRLPKRMDHPPGIAYRMPEVSAAPDFNISHGRAVELMRLGNPARRMPPSANWRVNFMNLFVKEFGRSPEDHEIQWAFDLYQRGFSVRSAVTRMMKRVGWKAERQPNIAIRRTPGPRTRASQVTLYPPNLNSVIATGTTDTGKNMIPFMFVELYATKGRLGLIAFGAYNAMGLIGPEKGGVALVDEKLHQVLGTHDVPYSRRGREQLFRQVYESANWFAAATALGFGMRFDREPNPRLKLHGFDGLEKDTAGRGLTWKPLKKHPGIEWTRYRIPGQRHPEVSFRLKSRPETQTGNLEYLERMGNPGAKWHRQEAGELRKIAAELPVDDHAAALDMVYQAERHELDAEQGYTGKRWHGRMARSEMQSALKYPTGKAHQMSLAGFVASRHSEEESEHYMEPGWDERAAKRRARGGNPTPAQGFQTFHHAAPDRTRRVKVPQGWPTKLWMLGALKLLILSSGKRIRGGTVCAATGNRMFIVNANYTGRLGPGERATQIEYVTPSVSERAGPVWFHPFDNPPPVKEAGHGFLTLAGKGIRLTRRGIVG